MTTISIPRRGFMLVLSSPSGAGKTTIARKLIESEDQLKVSISYTTRPKRSGEVEGQDYHFTDVTTFKAMIEDENFMEYARVFGHYYGTPKSSIEKSLAKGMDVLFDIDWQGTQQLKEVSTGDLVSVFVLPPSLKTLEDRLRMRAEDDEHVVAHRMKKAGDEMSHWAEYDYVIINNDLEESVRQVRSILTSERLKRRRQLGLAGFVNQLRDRD
jgi:guanylate kinase